MAKLTRYQESNTDYKSMSELTNAPIEMKLAASNRIDNFLAKAGEYFYKEATTYAIDKALENAIRNPITKEQLDQARQTGGNPITEYLQGGKIYNEAIKKVYSQQIVGELNLDLDKYHTEILDQVRLGKIANEEEMLSKLKEPIKAHVEFLNTIDPDSANQYAAKAAMAARNSYLTGDAIFRNKKEETAYLNAQITLENVVRDYDNYLRNYPNASIEEQKDYKDTIKQIAQDTSFSMSRNQFKLNQALSDALVIADNDFHARAIAQKYKGKTINEVLNQLPKDKSSAANYYMQSTDKDKFTQQIQRELAIVNSEIAARDKIAQRELRLINDNYLAEGQRIPPAKIKEMYTLVGPGSELIDQIDLMVKQSAQIEQLNKTSLPDLAEERDRLLAIKIDPNKDLTIEENQRLNILEPYIKNMATALKTDPVGTMGKRDGNFEELDLNDPDLASKVLDRKKLIERNADKYGINNLDKDMLLFSKTEIDAFVNTYTRADAQTRVAMLQVLDQKFGDDNSAALVQLIDGGLPTTAELSSYFNNPTLTSKLMSFDEQEEQKRLVAVAKEKGTTYNEVRKEIANQLASFDNVVMGNTPFSNRSIATKKLDNIKDALTYLAIHEMQTGKSLSSAVKDASGEFTNTFQLQDTYYVPKIYNGKSIDADAVVYKAERIKDIYLADFNAIPADSFNKIVDEKERDLEFRTQLVENGKWQNTADGTGLIFGITLADGSFGAIQNANGDFLTFKFNDTRKVVPYTNVDITAPKGETVIERRGLKTRAREKLQMSADQLRILEEKKAKGRRVFGLED